MGVLPSWLNPFDVFIALGLLAGIMLGFTRGLLRMAFAVIVIYIATVLAMTFYVPLGKFIGRIFTGMSIHSREALAFVLILILAAVILQFLLSRTYKNTEWPGIRQIDQLGGMVFGFFVTVLWIGLALVGINFVLSTPTPGTGVVQGNLIYYYQTSALVPMFMQSLPIALATLKPWVPQGKLPDIFALKPL